MHANLFTKARSYHLYVAPPAGAWIETWPIPFEKNITAVAPPAGAWMEEDIRSGLATRADIKKRIDFL
jgi:hypothetical protein